MPVAARRRHPSTQPYKIGDPALYFVGRTFDELTIVAPVARGGTAAVYLANDPSGRMVALKLLHPELARQPDLVARFHAELEIARRVHHAGLLTIHAATTIDGIPALIMEVAPGQPLSAMIGPGGMRLSAVLEIAAHVSSALDALHAAGYAHRDVKPDNIMVARAPGGRLDAIVLDFGISLAIGVRAADADTVSGTPLYMPPEQWRGGLVESRGDVYALGCVLHEALVGVPPFDGALVQLANAHYFRAPDRVSVHRTDVPCVLDDLIMSMLAKEAADRPDMATVANTLRAIVEGQRTRTRASNTKYW